MKRRFTSVITAFLAAALLTVSGYAESDEIEEVEAPEMTSLEGNSRDVEATSEVNIPSLKVTVPGSASYIANPYELELYIGSTHNKGAIICPDILVTNDGNSKIAVDVRAYGYPQGDAILSTTGGIDTRVKTKQMALYIEGGKKKIAKDGTVSYAYSNAYNAKTTALVTLEPELEEDEEDPVKAVRVLTVNKQDVGAFRVSGKVNTNTAEPWYLNDYVDLKLILNISPLSN